ncbi:MAG: putative ATP-binding protein involved in virulence [Phenylobacterium sp.]|jgi:predicted ATP-binding protein involved in virulence
MRINSVMLTNFRCFEQQTFSFDQRATVIIGNNTTGKSTILEALAVSMGGFLLGIPNSFAGVTKKAHTRNIDNQDIRRFFAKDQEVVSVEYKTPSIIETHGSLPGIEQPLQWRRQLKKLGGRADNSECNKVSNAAKKCYEQATEQGNTTLPVLIYYGTGRLWAGQNTNIDKLAETNTALGYYYSLKPDAQNKILMPWLAKMDRIAWERKQTPTILQAVYDAIIELIPGTTKCYYSSEYNELTLEFGSKKFPFSNLSDGQRNVVSLVGDLAMRCAHLNQHLGIEAAKSSPGVVLVDEIDANIHPSWQKNLIPNIVKYFSNIQFVFTTHSPFIVQSVSEGKIINLDDSHSYESPANGWDKSVEEISIDIMGLDTVRSKDFDEMTQTAQDYYALLNQGANDTSEAVVNLAEKLDYYEQYYAKQPAYVAMLKAQRRERGL